ncbi:twin-arginine translocase subunit TatB [Helicobacter monodelphidis]|uniref:Sec-independent protein translocase protein TatB n=1 Tax=Helicobacter sp. 15-1451 TaxID=2004995 RepID=UPI000DCC132D|nr:Sec-independent protein translocase protein TatB [Helicobacter sp. 15-1451]RAX58376.1 twin-arginine translocase subunit TatB [Helicobacter sp. 15-1451]
MFGMGFTEILLVAVVAIIALGPEKLPKAMVDIVRYFRAFKKTLDDAKQTIDNEMRLSELKEEALSYKNSIQKSLTNVTQQINLNEIKESANLKEIMQEKIDISPSTQESNHIKTKDAEILESHSQSQMSAQTTHPQTQNIQESTPNKIQQQVVNIPQTPKSIGFKTPKPSISTESFANSAITTGALHSSLEYLNQEENSNKQEEKDV